ncbi:hypothetical protein [Bacillus sp. 2205SS5-2]|uniref:hypothetical protein n=1 Tax=Bacillus sp. 2205SS5-2 TaxID=3109031 RepID=UPI00300770F2
MDKISCIAFILFQSEDPRVKDISLKLVAGDLSLKEVKKIKYCLPYLKKSEVILKNKTKLNQEEVCRFVEEYLFVH